MKSLIKKLFINNWPRKAVALALAIIVWLVVNQSLTTTKTVRNIPIRVINIPHNKTIDGIRSDGVLNRTVTLTLNGKKNTLEEISSNDLEVIIDAANKKNEWIVTISKSNLSSLNPEVSIAQGINKVSSKTFIVKLTKQVTDKIPIIVTKPIGLAPKGYHFIDVWPYHLYMTVSGPEEVVKKLKARGLRLTFNLNDVSKNELDDIHADSVGKNKDAVSFFVPTDWKKISVPSLSDAPIEINDPEAKNLRIDFVRYEMLSLTSPIPVNIYFPPDHTSSLHPQKVSITPNETVELKNGLKMITKPLYAKGVSELFVEVMKDMIEILVIVDGSTTSPKLQWSVQFINPHVLENRYVSMLMSDVSEEQVKSLNPKVREEYLRNRFRNYMNRFELYDKNNKKLSLSAQIHGNHILVSEETSP